MKKIPRPPVATMATSINSEGYFTMFFRMFSLSCKLAHNFVGKVTIYIFLRRRRKVLSLTTAAIMPLLILRRCKERRLRALDFNHILIISYFKIILNHIFDFCKEENYGIRMSQVESDPGPQFFLK